MTQMEAMKRFMVMQPLTREPNAMVAKNLLRSIKGILESLDIPKERIMSLVKYMLMNKVDLWWETIKRIYNK